MLAATGAVLLLIVGAIVTPIGSKFVDLAMPATGRLEAVDLVVNNTAGINQDTKPAILDIKVQNRGGARVVAKRVSLRLEKLIRINVCDTQGELPVTGTYSLSVPVVMEIGETLHEPLNQQVGPDEADRFYVRLQNPPQQNVHSISFYAFRVFIETNGDPSVTDLGAAILALPHLPSNTGAAWYWTSIWTEQPLDWLGDRQASVEHCLKTNRDLIREFLDRPGARSSELSALESDVR